MKITKNPANFYETHIFCCTNRREEGSSCCASKGSEELSKYFKQQSSSLGIKSVRVNKAGCLGRCKLGKVLVIYPEGIWYHYDDEKDIDLIIESHLKNGKIVEKLQLSNDQI